MSAAFSVAVVGATGAVGGEMVSILAQREFPAARLFPLASKRSLGKTVEFRGEQIAVEDLAQFDFARAQIALFSAGGDIARQYAPQAAAAGAAVVDNSSAFRQDDDAPLVVSEVNPEALETLAGSARKIVSNPNCSTMQMLVALKPIYDAVGIARINVATYQAVSGAGARAIEELAAQSRALLSGQAATGSVFPARIAFNALPHIDSFQPNGYTREEMKMAWETRKILADDDIAVNATAVRVPVFYGHSEAAHIETRDKISAATAREILREAPGVRVIDDPQTAAYPTPALEAAGADEVFVGRIREDLSHPRGLNLWIVGDNIRKGAALNTVQIAELLVARGLVAAA